jgi:hypothetical protein
LLILSSSVWQRLTRVFRSEFMLSIIRNPHSISQSKLALSTLSESNDATIADFMGRLHQVTDARMPIFGVTGLLATIAFAAVSPIGTTTSWLTLMAIALVLVQLSLYLTVAKPINTKMSEAAQQYSRTSEALG